MCYTFYWPNKKQHCWIVYAWQFLFVLVLTNVRMCVLSEFIAFLTLTFVIWRIILSQFSIVFFEFLLWFFHSFLIFGPSKNNKLNFLFFPTSKARKSCASENWKRDFRLFVSSKIRNSNVRIYFSHKIFAQRKCNVCFGFLAIWFWCSTDGNYNKTNQI